MARESSKPEVFNQQNPLIPVIRLSEMHYITGEAIFDKDPGQAIDWLDEARLGRGCKTRLEGAYESLASGTRVIQMLVGNI